MQYPRTTRSCAAISATARLLPFSIPTERENSGTKPTSFRHLTNLVSSPPWLAQQGVNCVIAGGMGARAQQLFAEQGVKVITGAQGEYPREVVENYLKGTLMTGENTCDH